MRGKVVLITGTNGGLGTFVTNAFLEAGAQVAGVSRGVSAASFSHPYFHAFPADITHPQGARQVVREIADKLGRIDIFVHITGGFAFARIDETDDDTWRRMGDLNLNSGFYVARELIPMMRSQHHGRIIAIGSLAAVEPHVGMGAYIASKMALHVLYRTIALENQDAGITSNVILPGTMDTPANRSAMPQADPTKWVDPHEVAKVVLMLAGDEAFMITGALVPVPAK